MAEFIGRQTEVCDSNNVFSGWILVKVWSCVGKLWCAVSICQIHVASGPIVATLSFIAMISDLQGEVLLLQVI